MTNVRVSHLSFIPLMSLPQLKVLLLLSVNDTYKIAKNQTNGHAD